MIFLLNLSGGDFFYSSRLLAWRACVCCNMRTFSGGLLTWASNIYTKNENERENLDTFWFEKCKKNASLGTRVYWVVKFLILACRIKVFSFSFWFYLAGTTKRKNTRHIYRFFNWAKIWQLILCWFTCFCSKSKQKQFHVRDLYKTPESTKNRQILA